MIMRHGSGSLTDVQVRQRSGVVIVLVVLGLLLGSGPAGAHSYLVSSDPADGSSVAAGPSRVTLRFNEPLQDGFDQVTVVGPDGNLWSTGEATVDGSSVSVGVTELGPVGTYTIGYRVISGDSHPVTGTVAFTLTTAGAGTPGASAVPPAGVDDGLPAWPFVVGAFVVFGAGLSVTARRTRRRAAT